MNYQPQGKRNMQLNYPDNLTADERIEFTAVNLFSHNVLRDQGGETKQPCWLCMSVEAKQEARVKRAEWYNAHQRPIVPVQVDNVHSLSLFERILTSAAASMMQQWVNVEAQYKKLRDEEHNPQAFFVS